MPHYTTPSNYVYQVLTPDQVDLMRRLDLVTEYAITSQFLDRALQGQGGVAIGSPVGGGTPSYFLYVDAFGNLANQPGGGGVTDVNTLTGSIILAAGSNITLTPVGNTITFDATNNGTVTSVDLTAPSIFTVTGNPITTSGTIDFSLNSQSQNLFFASPNGSSGIPSFRAIVSADLPSLSSIYLPLAGGTMTGELTLNPVTQVALSDAATIGQLAAFVSGAAWKSPGADVATTANITLSGEQTIDGVLTSASRVLVKNQASIPQNGLYVSAAGAWTRTTDADAPAELNAAAITVINGTVNASTSWVQITPNPTIGVSNVIWAPFGRTYLADGTTIILTGNTFSAGLIPLTTNVSGILPIANGGTNNAVAYTAGSVIFSNGTKLTEDNPNLFWDDTNNRLGIGTAATPRTSLTIGAFPATTVYGSDVALDGVTIRSTSALHQTAVIESSIARGALSGATLALASRDSVGAMTTGARLGSLSFWGSGDAGTNSQEGARISAVSAGGWSFGLNRPTSLAFFTATSNSLTQKMTLFNSGAWQIGTGNANAIANMTATIQPLTAPNIGLLIRGITSQSGDLQQWQNVGTTILGRMSAAGSLQAQDIRALGTAGAGYFQVPSQSANPTIVAATCNITADNAGRFGFSNYISTHYSYFASDANTADRTYTLIDASHIIANVPASGVVRSTGALLFTGQVQLSNPAEVTGILPMLQGGTNSSSIVAGFVTSDGTTLSSQVGINLTTNVTGVLPMANGGTNSASIAAGLVTSNGTTLSSKFNTTLKTTVTQNVATVTPTTITELTSPSLGTGTYKFEGVIVFQSTAGGVGTGYRMAPIGATLTSCYAKWSVAQAANGTAHNFEYDQLLTTTNVTATGTTAANTDALAYVCGTFTVSVAGTVAVQMRSETGASVSIRARSFITIEAI